MCIKRKKRQVFTIFSSPCRFSRNSSYIEHTKKKTSCIMRSKKKIHIAGIHNIIKTSNFILSTISLIIYYKERIILKKNIENIYIFSKRSKSSGFLQLFPFESRLLFCHLFEEKTFIKKHVNSYVCLEWHRIMSTVPVNKKLRFITWFCIYLANTSHNFTPESSLYSKSPIFWVYVSSLF